MAKIGSEISTIIQILAGVPQETVLSFIFYNLYSADQPTARDKSVLKRNKTLIKTNNFTVS